jgi:hypothetical protein
MIRDAAFADIPRIVAIMRDAHARSRYAREGLCGFDDKEAKRILVNAIQRHGRGRHAGAFVQVSEAPGGSVEGFIAGMLARVYHVGDKLMASDLFWLATPFVPARDPAKLMRNMVAWARAVENVIEIRCGTTAILQDPEKAGRILARLGMDRYGTIWKMEI